MIGENEGRRSDGARSNDHSSNVGRNGSFTRSIALFTRSYTWHQRYSIWIVYREHYRLAWGHSQYPRRDTLVKSPRAFIPKQVGGDGDQPRQRRFARYMRRLLYTPGGSVEIPRGTHVLIVSIGALENGPMAPDTRPINMV